MIRMQGVIVRIVVAWRLVAIGLIRAAAITAFLLIVYQRKRTRARDPYYIAMGSSFAAGIGFDPRAPDSPVARMRTAKGYPQQLVRLLDLPLLDVTCSGATTEQVLRGRQYFQLA